MEDLHVSLPQLGPRMRRKSVHELSLAEKHELMACIRRANARDLAGRRWNRVAEAVKVRPYILHRMEERVKAVECRQIEASQQGRGGRCLLLHFARGSIAAPLLQLQLQ